jgi:thioesterase domain-containing protein
MLTLTRNSYEAKAESQFIEMQSQLSMLAARAKRTVEAARADGERVLVAAQSKHDAALHRFELLKLAGDDSWDAVKTDFESAWTDLRHAVAPR